MTGRPRLGNCKHDWAVSFEGLVFKGNYGAAVAAEGGDSLQVAVGAGDGHHRAVAVDGVAGGGEVPLPPLERLVIWRVGWRRGFGGASWATGRLNNKARVRTFIVFVFLGLPAYYCLPTESIATFVFEIVVSNLRS